MPKFKPRKNESDKHTQELCEFIKHNKIENFLCSWDYEDNMDVPTLLMGKSTDQTAFLNLLASLIITIGDSFDMTQEEIFVKATELIARKTVFSTKRETVKE